MGKGQGGKAREQKDRKGKAGQGGKAGGEKIGTI